MKTFFEVFEDSSLSVAAPGLLVNDALTNDSLLVYLVTPPANGTVTLNEDGSFDYTPHPGFEGIDSFEYLIQTLPLQVLTVEPSVSNLNFDMDVSIVLGSDSDNVDASIEELRLSFLILPQLLLDRHNSTISISLCWIL